MKQRALLPLFILLHFCLHAQPEYAKIDSIAKTFEKSAYPTPDSLSRALTGLMSTDREKYRAIFTWITHNVRYDIEKYKNIEKYKPKIEASSPEEAMQKLAEWQEKNLLRTYRQGKGICGDYSQLFNRMCISAGLKCEIITGDSRSSALKRRKWESHAWNAIYLDEKWHLVDATWGAGYIDDDTERFKFRFSSGFFMAPPQFFIMDHLPDKDEWQLLETPLDKGDVKRKPMVNYGHPRYAVQDLK
ncbi:MAG TPA: transglutaminase domain-containing protein, partial [Saprospiraceae bacterium]|nr:transglutaminase domain-containing protein [Saprospiraceae bacterium]